MLDAGNVIGGNPIINDPYREPTRHWHFGGVSPIVRASVKSPPKPPTPHQLLIMAEYTHVTTLLERVGALGYAPHHAARHIRYGRVRVDGRVVTEPFAPVGDESDVEVRMVVGDTSGAVA